VREIEWTEAALEHMAALDKGIARRVKQAVERLANTGTGNVKKLQGVDPPEYRLAWATTESGSTRRATRFAFSASATAARPTANRHGMGMGYEAKKTEHSGPKRGSGAYWGYKRDAKKESNRVRRTNWHIENRNELAGADDGRPNANKQ
jgi:hypothetical protein